MGQIRADFVATQEPGTFWLLHGGECPAHLPAGNWKIAQALSHAFAAPWSGAVIPKPSSSMVGVPCTSSAD